MIDAERFWRNVDKTEGGCWAWRGAVRRGDYGSFLTGGKMRRAHRVAWEMANGPIPDGLYLLHSCDYPPCVNPAHLRPGTAAENMQDQIARNRRPATNDRWVSLREASRLLGVKASTLRSQIARGRLDGFMSECWHVRRSAVEQYRATSLGKPGRRGK